MTGSSHGRCSHMRRSLWATGLSVFLVSSAPVPGMDGERPPADPIPLLLVEDQQVDRRGGVASGGVPFPRGRVRDAASLQVYAPDGEPVPTQAHALGMRWPDGSLRWALVQFPAELGAGRRVSYRLSTEGRASPRPPATAVKVEDTGPGVTVDTGVLRFSLNRVGAPQGRASFLPARIESRGDSAEPWMDSAPAVRFRADREHMTPDQFAATGEHPNTLWSFGLGGDPGAYGDTFFHQYAQPQRIPWHDWSEQIEAGVEYGHLLAGPVELDVEEAGPVRVVVRFASAREAREGDIGYSGRIYAYAGSGLLRVELTIENYEDTPPEPRDEGTRRGLHISNAKHVREFALRFRPAFDVASVRHGVEHGNEAFDATPSSRLRHDAEDRYTVSRGGGAHTEGERAPGWMSVAGGGRRFSLATKYFREIYPKALGYDADTGEVVLELWPADEPAPGYPFAAGRIRTYEFVLGFDVDGEAASAEARAELRPWPDPEYMAATGAVHRFLPLTDTESFPSLAGFIDRSYRRFMAEHLRFGDIHFGDQSGWSRLSKASGYHGVEHEFFVWYLCSGDPAHFRLAEAAAWHKVDIDQFHWGRRAGEHVKQHTRYRDHTTPREMYQGHGVWNFGVVDYYFLTGKRRLLPVLERTADWLMGRVHFQPEGFVGRRFTSLPLMHLAYMVEAIGVESAFEELYPGSFPAGTCPTRTDAVDPGKARDYVDRMRQVSAFLTDSVRQGTYRPMPLLLSYVPEGLYRFWRLTGDEIAREGVVLAADFLYRKTIVPTGINHHSHDPGVLATRPDRNWRPWYDEVDLPAVRAWEVTGDRIYLEYAKAPLEWRLLYLGIARHQYGFNSTIPQTLWILREAGLTEADLRVLRPDIDMEPALAMALDHARQGLESPPGTGAAQTQFLLALEVSRVLINLGRAAEAVEWLGRWDHWADHPLYDKLERFRAQAIRARDDAP